MDTLISFLLFVSICFVISILAKSIDKRIFVVGALLCAVYLASDDLITGLPHVVKSLNVIPGHWNWSGKILSLVFSLIVIGVLRLSPDAVGLKLKQEHAAVAWAAIAFFIVWGACLGLLFKPGVPDGEKLAFQATMPGLAEEIAYRGIAPALLLSLLNRKPHIDGIPWSVIVAISAMFGLWHSLSYSNGTPGFDVMSGLFPFIGSILGGWVRFKTKSLLIPIACHGLANVAFHVAGGLSAGS
jgi:membrane protease YdiL (CAAX protease family)